MLYETYITYGSFKDHILFTPGWPEVVAKSCEPPKTCLVAEAAEERSRPPPCASWVRGYLLCFSHPSLNCGPMACSTTDFQQRGAIISINDSRSTDGYRILHGDRIMVLSKSYVTIHVVGVYHDSGSCEPSQCWIAAGLLG